MKKINLIFLLSVMIALVSCKTDKEDDEAPANDIGGETNININTVGTTFTSSSSVLINGTSFVPNTVLTTTKNEGGVITATVTSNLPTTAPFNLVPSSVKLNGKLYTTNFKYKFTSEGIVDYTNKDSAPFILVRFDANVGDVYSVTKSDGTTIKRTVTQKSTTDDFPYGFYNIKTITVEQDSRISGVKKIVYKLNHKFGLVYLSCVMEDGTSISSYVYGSKTN